MKSLAENQKNAFQHQWFFLQQSPQSRQIDVASPHGRMLATFLPGIAEFERDLISERVKSGLAAAKARGRKLGRQIGVRPKSDRLAPKVMKLIDEGRSYRWISRDLGISKNTVGDIAKRDRNQSSNPID